MKKLFWLILLLAMPDLQIVQAQPAVQQFEILGNNNSVGRFTVRLASPGGLATPAYREAFRSVQPFQLTLESVRSVMIQVWPGFSPLNLFCFGPNPDVNIFNATHKILCVTGVDYLGATQGGLDVMDLYTAAQVAKWRPGQTTFGPFAVPPDIRYFRVYSYVFGNAAAPGDYTLSKSHAGFYPPSMGAGGTVLPDACMAWITFVGN